MTDQIYRIKTKLTELSDLDRSKQIFGSSTHEYYLNKCLTADEILKFEKEHLFNLPEEYKMFLSLIGNGIAGPNYGLIPLKYCLLDDLDNADSKERLDPSKPFKFKSKWNLEFGDFNEAADEKYFRLKDESEYYSSKWMDGTIRLSNAGCAIAISLVVNGDESGNIWVDDRGSDQGIYPLTKSGKDRISFADWYEGWLDNSLDKAKNFSPSDNVAKQKVKKGFWGRLFK